MKLIDNWTTHLWRAWSIRLAALAGIVAAYLAANPDVTQQLLAILPDGPARVLASAGIGLFVFALATGSRLVKQGPAAPQPSPEKEPTE
ncbi:MAG: hypothetical protein RIS17_15 [Pseudomonadota bacterium]